MKRRIAGLSSAAQPEADVADGVYLVQVAAAQYRWDKQKPYYLLHLSILEPEQMVGSTIVGRLYCSVRALWKLSWFLRDFNYPPELLDRDELDEKVLIGLNGVVKVSHTTLNGRTYLNLEAFAPAEQWRQQVESVRYESSQEDLGVA